MTFRAPLAALTASLLLAGCGASLPSLTTGSLFGGAATTAAAGPPQLTNDPTARAMQVGTTSARAIKCGFNFDPVKLRTQFLAAEAVVLTSADDAAKVGKIYDVSFNAVSKAVAGQDESYCNQIKTAKIKDALNRHLAGDYTPTPPEPAPEEDGGLFGSLGSSSSGGYKDNNPLLRNE